MSRDMRDHADFGASVASAAIAEFRKLSGAAAAVPHHRNAHMRPTARRVVERLGNPDPELFASPATIFDAEAIIARSDLPDDHRALAMALVTCHLYDCAGVAIHDRTTMRAVSSRRPAASSTAPRRTRTMMGVPRARARGAGRPRTRSVSRASSRGGDSGDDGEPEPDGDPAGRRCEICDANIDHRRADARTCERAACKKRRQRAEQRKRLALAESNALEADAAARSQLTGREEALFDAWVRARRELVAMMESNRGLEAAA